MFLRNLGLLLFLVLSSAFLTSSQTAVPPTPAVTHNWTTNADVPPDDPSTPGAENVASTPDGTTVTNTGKKGDPNVRVKYCSGDEQHGAHTDIDANGAGNDCNVTVGGNGATVNIDGGKGKDAGSRTNVTGQGNSVNTTGQKNCATLGPNSNGSTVNHAGGANQGNHTHGGTPPPPH